MRPLTGIDGLGISSEQAALRACEASRASFARLMAEDAFALRIHVPDMVPSLRDWRLSWDAAAVLRGSVHIVADRISDLAIRLTEEREARRWFAVDP